jgi:multidrug resistance protein MdtO
MAAVVGLTGRLSDLGSTMAAIPYQLMQGDPRRVSEVVRQVDQIRQAIDANQPPPAHELPLSVPSGVPLLPEVERTVALIPRVFSETEPVGAYIPSVLDDGTSPAFFVRDAFSNNEHVKFAIRGCLAATICYFLYSILDWNGLSTSVTTCVLTALTNIGSSRQKQLLRFAGTAAGGIIFGVGAQVFILPEIDSITQFTLLFAAVTAVGAWFATASPRLSYFGIQLALAFYLINLQEFTIQTSLAIARDRVVGVFLGLFVMWLIFDQIWAKPAAEEMITIFTANVRLIADLSKRSTAGDPAIYIKWIRASRNTIYNNFQSVTAQADAIPFEFGPRRKLHMVARAHIRRWQPELRTLYLLQVASLHHRIFGAGADFPKPLLDAQDNFHQGCARILDSMADHLEGKDSPPNVEELDAALRKLEENLAQAANETSGGVFARAEGFMTLSRQISLLLEDLFHDVNRTPSTVFVKM